VAILRRERAHGIGAAEQSPRERDPSYEDLGGQRAQLERVRTDSRTRARSSGFQKSKARAWWRAQRPDGGVAEIMMVGTAGARERASMPERPGSLRRADGVDAARVQAHQRFLSRAGLLAAIAFDLEDHPQVRRNVSRRFDDQKIDHHDANLHYGAAARCRGRGRE